MNRPRPLYEVIASDACDWVSNTLTFLDYVIDWGHTVIPKDPITGESSKPYTFKTNYAEGQFMEENNKEPDPPCEHERGLIDNIHCRFCGTIIAHEEKK